MELLFGKPCAHCQSGWQTRRWARYDGTGSWKMHQRGSMIFDDYELIFCERNGWFTRHRFLTALLVVGIPIYGTLGILVALG